jgi:hypothetical protein
MDSRKGQDSGNAKRKHSVDSLFGRGCGLVVRQAAE